MKIFILHLSDIHFEKEKNPISDRVEAIKNVVNKYDISICFIVVSGDIAFSGKFDEYQIALGFFTKLKDEIKSAHDSVDIKYVMVPGNHDCNFDNDTNLRKWLVDNMPRRYKDLDTSIIDQCTSVQKDFFEFLSKFLNIGNLRGFERIYYKQDFSINNYKICFNCYNTAWVSQLHEKQGQIVFPINLVKTANERFDLVISILHHPYNWFESENVKEFKKHIEQTSDIIITGHEHIIGQAIQAKITGEINEYIEGGILQGDTEKDSEFNVIILDLENKKQKVIQYTWKDNIYHEKWDAPKFWTLLVLGGRYNDPLTWTSPMLGLKNLLFSAFFPYFLWCFISKCTV